jgi:hypothetical protein
VNIFSRPTITTNLFYTYPSIANTAPFSADIKQLTTFTQLNGIDVQGRKGQVFSIERASQRDRRNFKITFAPTHATPILMRTSKNANGVYGAFYGIKKGNQVVSSSQVSNNWSWWTGAASYSPDCTGLDGSGLAAGIPDRGFGTNSGDSRACALANFSTDQALGLAGNTSQFAQRGNEAYYFSVFYSPNIPAGQERYYLQTACNDSDSGFRSLINYNGDYPGRIYLNEAPNASLTPTLGSDITYVDDLFRALNADEQFMCLGIKSDKFEITWNEEKLFKTIASTQHFENNGLTSCYYAAVNQ